MYPRELVPKFFDGTAATYDTVASWATFGKDKYWKNVIISKIPEGDTILELACGTGILTRKIAQKFPDSRIVGVDITKGYLEVAKRNSSSFQNISFVCQDAEMLNLDEKFDCIVSSYIPKYCNPKILAQVCEKHLKPNGTIILHDFTYPQNRLVRSLWNAYFVLLKLVGNLIPEWKEAFAELPKLIRTTTWVASYEEEMKKIGISVQCQYLTWSTCAIVSGVKRST
jgi:demethylmenaquinone methyltransferase/2-methoxy-6-polyprenyl-1,4-benzoquinol methylase